MSTQAAATDTAQTTVEATEPKTPVVPGRDEILKHFAKEVIGEPDAEAPPSNATAENNATDALSQTEVEATETETPATVADDEPDDSLPAEVQEKINRRIGKEVAKTKAEREAREAAETRLAEIETRLAEAEAAPKSEVKAPALSEIHEPVKLEAEKLKAEQALEQSENLLAEVDFDPASVEQTLRAAKIELRDEEGREDYSEARMKKFLHGVRMNADRTLRKAIPERARFLETANKFANEAVDWMPELKDPKSERSKKFRQVVRENPLLQQRAEWPGLAMLGVLGMEKLEELQAAKAKATAPVKPKKELPVTIPIPRAQAPTMPIKAKPQMDSETIATKLLNGERSARLEYLKTLMPR